MSLTVHISNFYNNSTHVDLSDILLLQVWSESYSVLPCFSHTALTILSCNMTERLRYSINIQTKMETVETPEQRPQKPSREIQQSSLYQIC